MYYVCVNMCLYTVIRPIRNLHYFTSICIIALESTHPVTEMSTRDYPWGGGGGNRPVRRANNLATFICQLSSNSASLNLLEP
jgi:hypothetical protein